MSLKAFHVVFVSVSILFCVAFGVWEIRHWLRTDETQALVLGLGSFVGTGVLLWYGKWFLRKLEGMSYL